MLGAHGLVAYILTVHQPSLLLSAALGLLVLFPYGFVVRARSRVPAVWGGVFLFVGVTLIAHSLISSAAGVSAFSLEVVKVASDDRNES